MANHVHFRIFSLTSSPLENPLDPNATLDTLVEALTAHDWSAAKRVASDLATWLERGGFAPDWSRHPQLDELWHTAHRAS